MNTYIRYQRFSKHLREGEEVQKFFEELITEGWQIIYYSEKVNSADALGTTIDIVVVAGKIATLIKNIL